MKSIIKIIPALCILASFLTFAADSYALQGDWEIGGSADTILMPKRDIYGAGAEFYAHYFVLDGLSVNISAGIFGARQTDLGFALGLYTLRTGLTYALDILEWVPAVGLHFSTLFSEDKHYSWHNKAHGLALDFDVSVQYRGIRHIGIGLFFSYHLVFVDDDYMTMGLSLSWYSGMF